MTEQAPRKRMGAPPLPHTDERLVIGLGSGSSLDGIDAALVRIQGSCETAKLELKHFICVEFDDETRLSLLELFEYQKSTIDKLCVMHAIMGELFAEAALLVAEQHGTPMSDVDCIGIWGQMMYHMPTHNLPFEWRGKQLGSSMQIGDLNRVAVRTGVTTIGDGANADISAGGNGAPTPPLVDYALYHDGQINRAVQNIGGIGNFNFMPAEGGIESVVGMDTGPGVMVIDGLVRYYTDGAELFDRDGERAARGTVSDELLQELMKDEYIQMAPPKAAGREQYGTHFVRRVADLAEKAGMTPDDAVATATALTVESIAISLERYAQPAANGPTGTVDEIIVGGGGALNPALLKMLAERTGCPVTTHEDYDNPSFAMEAMIQAATASETYIGHTDHNPSLSGSGKSTFAGLIAPGYYKLPPRLSGNGWRAADEDTQAQVRSEVGAGA
ncbi:MAG: anhydro-N-acetylmuramic acid kinase [Gaiellaceae bacterium]|nr:anhydro-N-acetylmuramic acid kinase [Gaiellaceae bacterium]